MMYFFGIKELCVEWFIVIRFGIGGVLLIIILFECVEEYIEVLLYVLRRMKSFILILNFFF